MTMLFVKTVPQNPYDKGLLKRYIDSALLDAYVQNHADNQVLVWDPQYAPNGTLGFVNEPPSNVLADMGSMNIQPVFPTWLWRLVVRLGFGAAITSPVWLRLLGFWRT